MTGSSGARVVVHATYAVKSGDARVGEQGQWLQEHHGISTIPRVFDVYPTLYTMEILRTPSRTDVQLADILHCLRPIWERPARVAFDAKALRAHLVPVINTYAPELLDAFCNAVDGIERLHSRGFLTACEVHGDPTLENVMMRWISPKSAETVVIDPLPARPYAPDLLAVDLGKLLQSTYGWENDRYGREDENIFGMDVDKLIYTLEAEFSVLDVYAGACFAFVHLIRALPYIDEDARQRVLQNSIVTAVRFL